MTAQISSLATQFYGHALATEPQYLNCLPCLSQFGHDFRKVEHDEKEESGSGDVSQAGVNQTEAASKDRRD
jgi:hypothetical protein